MSRNAKILEASKKVKEEHLKTLLRKVSEGTVTKRELEVIEKLEQEFAKEGRPEKQQNIFLMNGHNVAEFFGVTLRTIQLWASEGGCPKLRHGLYDLKAVHAWWLSNIAHGKDSEETEDIKREYWKWKTDAERIKVETLEGLSIPKKSLDKEWGARLAAVSSGLDMLPYQVAPHIEMCDQPTIVRVLLDKIWSLKDNFCRTGNFCPPPEGPK